MLRLETCFYVNQAVIIRKVCSNKYMIDFLGFIEVIGLYIT